MTTNTRPESIDHESVLRDIVAVLLDLPAPASAAALEARERLAQSARALDRSRWRRPNTQEKEGGADDRLS